MRRCMAPNGRCYRSISAGVLLVTALGLFSAPTLAAEAAAQARETIVVQGNRRVDAETIRSYFHATPDGRFDAAARDAALKALLATGLFDNVAIDRNKKIKDTELTAVIESKPRGTLQRAVVQADVGRIVEAYRHVGRDDVGVVPQIIDRGSDQVDLVYVVTEGGKTTVRQINFVGNHIFGKRQLGAVIKTSATQCA